MRHSLFLAFAATSWFALYIAVVVLLAQVVRLLSTRYAPDPEDQALTELRKRIAENRRQSRVKRLEAVWDEAQSIIAEEDAARKASRILAMLDDDTAQDSFALDVDAAQAYLEYRAATDGKKIA